MHNDANCAYSEVNPYKPPETACTATTARITKPRRRLPKRRPSDKRLALLLSLLFAVSWLIRLLIAE